VLFAILLTRIDSGFAGRAYTIDFSHENRAGTVTADQLLVATGRRANTKGFGLDEVEETLGKKGEIVVNEYLQTALSRKTA